MKVTQNPTPNTTGLEKAKAADKTAAPKGPQTQPPAKSPTLPGGAAVDISDQAHLMKEARDIVYAAPDMQMDKVSDLKRRIKEGSYKVDSSAVADKLVDEHLASHFGKNDL
jgi:negative regulator of flagellin synthesis FlgM